MYIKGMGTATNFVCRTFDHANYEDPDINVAIPVFSIHGNHDDPSGVSLLLYTISLTVTNI